MATLDKLQPGQDLFLPLRTKRGMEYHIYRVIEVDVVGRRARLAQSSNPSRWYTEKRLANFRVNRPKTRTP